jgi:hypothetical protein
VEHLFARPRQGRAQPSTVVGEFTGNRGEFFHQENFKGRVILVRYVWLNISRQSARMEQSFSPDGGKTWEVNWICEHLAEVMRRLPV